MEPRGEFLPQEISTEQNQTVELLQFTSTTLEQFASNFENLELYEFFILEEYPTKEQAQQLAALPNEILIIQSKDGTVYITKGEETSVKTERDFYHAIGVVKMAHTHPKQVYDNIDRRMFTESIPSSQDLTTRGLGVEEEYIYNSFGRTTYRSIQNLGNMEGRDEDDRSMTQRIVDNALAAAARKARELGIGERGIEEVINFMGQEVKIIGCEFKFEPWENIESL